MQIAYTDTHYQRGHCYALVVHDDTALGILHRQAERGWAFYSIIESWPFHHVINWQSETLAKDELERILRRHRQTILTATGSPA